MRAIALLALLALCPPQGEDEREGPDPKRVAEAVRELESALAQRDPALREAALLEYRVPAPEVVALLAKAVGDREERVRRAALEALRYTPHESALEALHKTWKRDKALRKHVELAPVLYRAIGWHGDPESLSILESNLFGDENPESIRARILAMGNIRHVESIEHLLDVGRKTRGLRVRPYVDELRTSLAMLLGVDKGEVLERWEDHWKEVRKEFVMAEKPPLLPEALQYRWNRFWGLETRIRRGPRREDRGSEDGPGR